MATAFTQQEKRFIRRELRRGAREFASSIGMRRTTVEQLAAAAGISKGAFYKFYDTKELLFFEVLEEFHSEIYGRAEQVLECETAKPPAQRMADALLAAFYCIETASMMDFWENEIPLLLRKIPKEVLDTYYHSDETHILNLMRRFDLRPNSERELVVAVIRTLMLTLAHRKEIGAQYSQALDCLVRGACKQFF